MTEEVQKQVEGESFDEGHISFINFHYCITCPHCDARVLDPDKKRNQTHLKDRCPKCGQLGKDFKRPTTTKPKRLSKKEKRRIKQEKDAIARGKY